MPSIFFGHLALWIIHVMMPKKHSCHSSGRLGRATSDGIISFSCNELSLITTAMLPSQGFSDRSITRISPLQMPNFEQSPDARRKYVEA